MTRKDACKFKIGDNAVCNADGHEWVYKGGIYKVLEIYQKEWIVIVDEFGITDIYRQEYFDFDKNRIVNDILNDL